VSLYTGTLGASVTKRPPTRPTPATPFREPGRPLSAIPGANLGTGSSEDKPASERRISAYPARTSTPLKITPAVLDAICDRLAEGSPLGPACYLEGVAPQSLRELGQRNPGVALQVEQARAKGSEALRNKLMAGAASELKTCRTYEWMLERLHPRDYGPPVSKQEISGPEGAPVESKTKLEISMTDAKRILRKRGTK